jgi:hypothetical protein
MFSLEGYLLFLYLGDLKKNIVYDVAIADNKSRCCESRNPETVFFLPLDPGSGSRIQDGKKSESRMEKKQDPGWKKIRIRDGKKSGSELNIPDPQH